MLERTENISGRIALPLSVLLSTLRPLERKFIEKLDNELEKVENFYMARERDALLRYEPPVCSQAGQIA